MSNLHARALDLFDEYVDLAAAEQSFRLTALARESRPLHDLLDAMLRAHRDQASHILERSPMTLIADAWRQAEFPGAAPTADPRLGSLVGPWRISRVVASGGMGTVYEARRADGHYHQRVALKFVRADLAAPRFAAAFRRERELLAMLDHPGIAGLVDGGIYCDGEPWFAMRYVEGVAVDAWCDVRCATTRTRVEMLAEAGRALVYAHARGVVHGDIKPSNLLVEPDGRIQVVDFGISGHVSDRGEAVAISRDYAAPECLEDGHRSISADIYSFGILMYRVLAGAFPSSTCQEANNGSATPMDRLAMSSCPEIAHLRGEVTTKALERQLAGDLAAIAGRAAACRTEDRYASLGELVDDLQRWLDGSPVSARPISRLLWAGRQLQRHRRAAALASCLALGLSIAASTAYWQYRRGIEEAEASESISQLFASNLGVATISGLGSSPFSSRKLLMKTEREMRLLPLERHPVLHARALAILARRRAEIGDMQDAYRLADEAVRTLGKADDPTGAVVATHSAMLNLRGRHREAESLARRTLATLAPCERDSFSCDRTALLVELAHAQWGLAQPRLALRSVNAALQTVRYPVNRELGAELLVMRGRFNGLLMQNRQAEKDDRDAIALASDNPVLADDAREQLLGLLRRRQSPDVLPFALQLLGNRKRSLGAKHPKTGWAWIHLGVVQHPEEGKQSIGKGLAIIGAAYGRDHPEYAAAVTEAMWHMDGSHRDKVARMEQVIETLTRDIGPRGEATLRARAGLGSLLLDMPGAHRTQADTVRGLAMLENVVRDLQSSGLPASRPRLKIAEGLVNFGPDERLREAGRLLEISGHDARLYFSRDDAFALEVGVFRNKLSYRMGERLAADRAFSVWISQNRSFASTVRVHGRSVNDFIRAMTIYESMLYRALYAHETCRPGLAIQQLRQAGKLAVHAFGESDHRVELVQDMRRDLIRGVDLRVPVDAGFFSPDVLAAGNGRAARCRTSSVRHSGLSGLTSS